MKTYRKPDEQDKAKGRELARLRKAAGLSQEQLAARLGISTKQLGKYERGQSRMTAVRYDEAMRVIRQHAGTKDGFAEEQAPYGEMPDKGMLLRMLKLCIKIVERL